MDERYDEIKITPEVGHEDKFEWTPFLRQLYVCSGAWVIYFLCGLSLGAPTVFISQIRKEANSTHAVSEEMASWLSSVFGYSALPWVFIICTLTHRVGRKIPFAMVSLNTFSYYTLMYFSSNNTQILISEIMQGMNHASNMTLSIMIVSEYASPKYRGIFLTIKSATLFWGIWVANAIGTFCNWKYIPLIGICISIYMVTLILWPESPQWLASKGRYDECRLAHRWLNGADKKSEKELHNLINSQKEHIKSMKKETAVTYVTNIVIRFSRKAFYKPVLLSVVMMMQYHLTGKVVCVMYALEIIKKVTDDEATAYYGMLILDGVTVTGMYIGCVLTKFLKRRTLLFTSSTMGISFLFVMSCYLYLIKLSVISESKILTIGLLMIFSITISCGPMIMSTSIYGEITPLRYKSSCMVLSALTFVILTSTLLKFSPYMFRTLDMHGAFLFYGISSAICTVFLFKYLPETKDKTLQEIEDEFDNRVVSDEGKELLSVTRNNVS